MRHSFSNLPRRLLRGMVRGYQLVVSPYFPSSCRFTPTCSEYAIQALEKYGAAKGTLLALHRISRCHPWGGHGYDPPRWYGEDHVPSPPAYGEEVIDTNGEDVIDANGEEVIDANGDRERAASPSREREKAGQAASGFSP